MEQLQTENSAAGGLSDLTDVLGVAVSPAPTFPAVLDACCGSRMFWLFGSTGKTAAPPSLTIDASGTRCRTFPARAEVANW